MPVACDFFLPDRQSEWAIKLQREHGRTTRWANSQKEDTFPTEVNSPRVDPWVEEADFCCASWINCSLSCALTERAGNTGERQIFQGCLPARVDRPYMIKVEDRLLASLG
jgi:hypothetical protein